MKRIGTAGSLFVAEDPTTGAEGTVVTAEWLNSLQEEAAHVIEGAGIPLDDASTVQLLAAIKALAAAPGGNPVLTANQIVEVQGSSFVCFKLPGGTIVQAVQSGPVSGDSTGAVTWPIAFPTRCISAVATSEYTPIQTDGGGNHSWGCVGTLTGATIYNDGAAAAFSVIAMGY